jgi:hypothetical protein
MAYVIKMPLPLRVYADNKHFPKNFNFKISINQANDAYAKIYETAQLTMFYVFLIEKQISRYPINFANVLWVAFSISSGSLSFQDIFHIMKKL